MKRLRAYGLYVTIYNANGSLKRITKQGDIDDGETDHVDYVIHFTTPIEVKRAQNVHINVQYCGNYRVKNKQLFGRPVWPLNQDSTHLIFKRDVLEYVAFQTHQLRIEKTVDGNQVVCAMYFRLLNITTANVPHYDYHLCADVDVAMDQIESLAWFPPDVDPTYWGLKIDTRTIPQRSPLWFAARGAMSGSLAYKLLGFFHTTKPTQDRSKIRLGTHSEQDACILYQHYFPNCKLSEVGWCPAKAPYPSTWGASPDMLLEDSGFTGVLEIKTSQLKTTMEDYFYPQMYMEMIATESTFADLMRYRPNDVAYVYRIHRDAQLESMLVELWKRALQAKDPSVLYQTPDFVNARNLLSKMASDASWECNTILKVTPECTEKIRAHHKRVDALRESLPAPDEQVMLDVDDELFEKSLEVARAIRAKRPKTEITQLMAQQLNLLSHL